MIRAVQQPDSLAVLGHEVRNLIATFVGFSELLLNQDWPPEKQREYLQTMRDEGVRVSQFLNELLDLERLEAGVVVVRPRATDMRALLEFAANVAAHDPRHPVSLQVANDDLPLAFAEPDRIQQVLANLLSNARKYSPHGGPIRLCLSGGAQVLEVCVEDSGVGIPPDALEHVFDKFFRVESRLHRNIRGTGLGLAVCREIVEAHQGHIWAESAGLGHGTRICFTLPAAEASKRFPCRSEGLGNITTDFALLDARHVVRGPDPFPDARLLVSRYRAPAVGTRPHLVCQRAARPRP